MSVPPRSGPLPRLGIHVQRPSVCLNRRPQGWSPFVHPDDAVSRASLIDLFAPRSRARVPVQRHEEVEDRGVYLGGAIIICTRRMGASNQPPPPTPPPHRSARSCRSQRIAERGVRPRRPRRIGSESHRVVCLVPGPVAGSRRRRCCSVDPRYSAPRGQGCVSLLGVFGKGMHEDGACLAQRLLSWVSGQNEWQLQLQLVCAFLVLNVGLPKPYLRSPLLSPNSGCPPSPCSPTQAVLPEHLTGGATG